MMKHLFSSGEVMYKKNQKNLAEGLLVGEFLQYGDVEPGTEFICKGIVGSKEAQVHFVLDDEDYNDVKSRYVFKILMQSDLLNAKWKQYHIKYI